jgi:protein-S-isoprenylcysteine O-methyltransferase Ste14
MPSPQEILQSAAFVSGSAVIVYVSRASLSAPGSHGFFRFLAWELILALGVLDAPVWFAEPLAPYQLVSWPLLVVCILPLVLGVRELRTAGKPTAIRAGDPSLLAFEKTTALVTTGIYRYIRHPLYSSLLFLGWGIFFKSPSWLGLLLALGATACLFATAIADESECLRFFGPAYREYMRGTKRFVPFLI